jgi:DNA-binding MarR family transcriptional regulator
MSRAPARKSRDVPASDLSEPMAPALMRRCHELAMGRLFDDLQAAGFGDVRPSHHPVLSFPGPQGSRPGDIAARTGRSKQHVNILLNELERSGYLERRPDPADSRGKVVTLTKRGERLMAAVGRSLQDVEAEWSGRLGKARFESLRSSLQELGG